MTGVTAPPALARESAGEPRRIGAGRAGWIALRKFAALRDDWRDLVSRALEPNVFYDPAFALAAAPAFGDPHAVAVWTRSGKLIGLFPARIERRYGVLATLTGWTHPYAPLGVPLVDRDEAEAAIAGFLDHVEANEHLPKLLMLPLVATGGLFAEALARVLLRHGGAMEMFGAHQRALLEPAGERIKYLDGAVNAKKLKELRRQRRRLLDKGQLHTRTAQSADEMPRALSDFLTLEASGWKGRGGSAAAQHGAHHTFMRDALTALAAEGNARIDALMHNGHPLATTIALRSGTSAWFWKIAYDEDASRGSPGVQLVLDLTRSIAQDNAVARVDSCATADHPMIDHLWRERLVLTDLLIAPGRGALAQFRIARPLEALRRALIASAKRARDLAKR
jgi:CelD/BcsL family acetyltransferase involved in cellulose biosynthesis